MSLKPQSNFMAIIFHLCDKETKSAVDKSSFFTKSVAKTEFKFLGFL